MKKLQRWQEEMVEAMMEDPQPTVEQLSERFDKCIQTIYNVQSDAMFKAALAERKAQPQKPETPKAAPSRLSVLDVDWRAWERTHPGENVFKAIIDF